MPEKKDISSWIQFAEKKLRQIDFQLLPAQCTVCGKILLGQAVKNLWGDLYCAQHQGEYPPCECCGRLISPRSTGGGTVYKDGRHVCNICRETAVDTKAQALPILHTLSQWLYDRGIRFQELILKVSLVDAKELQQRLGNKKRNDFGTPGVIRADLGFIRKRRTRRDGTLHRRVDGVTLLQGLPQDLFEGVAAHELGHAWLFLAGVDNLEPWVEEGFCNLLSYILHKDRQTDEARFWVKTLEVNPDPVYGEGFRRVRAIFKRYGFGEALNYTFRHKQIPPE